jgi:uncharacterized protein YoxC
MGGVAALICAISFALLMLALMIVVLKLARTMAITNYILDDIRKEAIPLMARIETTIDHINNEMGYVDGVLKSAEKLAARANTLTQAAQSLVTSPLVKVLSLGLGVQSPWTQVRRERENGTCGGRGTGIIAAAVQLSVCWSPGLHLDDSLSTPDPGDRLYNGLLVE